MELSEKQFSEITGIRMDDPVYELEHERRKHPRVGFGSRARIFPVIDGAGGHGCPVLIRDISRAGMGFLFGEELAISDEFIVQFKQQNGDLILIQCMVQRCELGGTGLVQFCIGATFELVLDTEQWLKTRPVLPANAGGSMGPMSLTAIDAKPIILEEEPSGRSWRFWRSAPASSAKLDRSQSKIRSRLQSQPTELGEMPAVAEEVRPMPVASAAPAAPLQPMPGAVALPVESLDRTRSSLFQPAGAAPVEMPEVAKSAAIAATRPAMIVPLPPLEPLPAEERPMPERETAIVEAEIETPAATPVIETVVTEPLPVPMAEPEAIAVELVASPEVPAAVLIEQSVAAEAVAVETAPATPAVPSVAVPEAATVAVTPALPSVEAVAVPVVVEAIETPAPTIATATVQPIEPAVATVVASAFALTTEVETRAAVAPAVVEVESPSPVVATTAYVPASAVVEIESAVVVVSQATAQDVAEPIFAPATAVTTGFVAIPKLAQAAEPVAPMIALPTTVEPVPAAPAAAAGQDAVATVVNGVSLPTQMSISMVLALLTEAIKNGVPASVPNQAAPAQKAASAHPSPNRLIRGRVRRR